MKPGTGQRSRDTCGRYLKRFRGAPLDGSNVWTSVSVCTQKYKMSSSIRPLMFNSTPSTVMILDSCEDKHWLFTCWAHCCCSMCKPISVNITHQATLQLQPISAAPWRIIWDFGSAGSQQSVDENNRSWHRKMHVRGYETDDNLCSRDQQMPIPLTSDSTRLTLTFTSIANVAFDSKASTINKQKSLNMTLM